MTTKAQLLDKIRRNDFMSAYLECMLWTEESNLQEQIGDSDRFDAYDRVEMLAVTALRGIIADCNGFLDLVSETGTEMVTETYTSEQAGHDFWLTRNGHGAGFWDRGIPSGNALTKLAKSFGSADLYVANRRIYIA